ncbi:hypothetical protein [Sphingomonas sp. Leaf357]|uniref:hypothetical protein n=1 Tax=Sphingomonas sp. Leaf357 TaxID=1736350 RepID=UPI0012E27A0E|nr:hypothetical protein [Sphingomonas sp. Leaf357]
MILLGAAIAVAAPTLAQQAARTTVQQEFDAATALQDKRDFVAALAAWTALEGRVKNPRTRALVLARKSGALLSLDRKDEAAAAARASLAGLPAGDASVQEDRFNAFIALGRIAEAALDYASAAQAFGEAERIAQDPVAKIVAGRGLVQTQTFVDPAAAAQALTRLDGAVASVPTDAGVKATVQKLRGQLLLNQGAFAASRQATGEAVKLLGGLTAKTNLDDVEVRSNYAIAALLEGRKDEARQYMAMTGAGRIEKGSFDPGPQMKVPECGGEAGLKPADVAVVDFNIGDDGVVRDSAPVYAAGGGQVALEFARAARNWSWTPEQVTKMPRFFRYRVRAELRCSTAFERPSIASYLDGELGAWLELKKVAPPPMLTGSDAAILPQLRVQLAEVERAEGGSALALVPILHQLVANNVVGREEAGQFARRELAILIANGAPPVARLSIEPATLLADTTEGWKPAVYARIITPLLTAQPYAADPEARSAIRLMIADKVREDRPRARLLLGEVGAESALPQNHPFRVGALVRLASLEQQAGDSAAATAAFAKSGLSAQQCALVDSQPRMLGYNGSGDQFPLEAQMWGFEGWTAMQYDISAEGKVVNQRVVVAYPPFVFGDAGLGLIKTARYEKSYRPDGGLGCGGSSLRVNFRLPH